MSVIYKYEVELDEKGFDLYIKGLSQVLKVGVQHDKVVLWCKINLYSSSLDAIRVYAIPTGYEFQSTIDMEYLDSVILYGGDLVFHMYYSYIEG